MKKTTLILGACGLIGTELTLTLREKYGNDAVVATDIKEPALAELKNGPFEILDASDAAGLRAVCEKYNVGTVYHLVAMLSATGEKFSDESLGFEHAELVAHIGISQRESH